LVLQARDLGEKDRLAVLLTRQRGKVRAAARSARRPKSKLAPLIQPFSRVALLLWEGRTFDGLRQGEVIQSFRSLRENLTLMAHASCMAELARDLTQEDDPDEPHYLLLLTCFRLLEGGVQPPLVLAFYLVRALRVAGFAPELGTCLVCGRTVTGGTWFSPASGGVVCRRCPRGAGHPISGEQRTLLSALGMVHPRNVEELKTAGSDLTAVNQLLFDYAEFHLDRRIKSRSFLEVAGGGR